MNGPSPPQNPDLVDTGTRTGRFRPSAFAVGSRRSARSRSHRRSGLPRFVPAAALILLLAASAAEAQSVPGAPTDIRVTEGHHAARIDWSAPADDGGAAISGYYLQEVGAATATSLGNVTTHTLTPSDGTRSYQLYAANANGNGDLSAPFPVAIVPASVTITSPGSTWEEQGDVRFTLKPTAPCYQPASR